MSLLSYMSTFNSACFTLQHISFFFSFFLMYVLESMTMTMTFNLFRPIKQQKKVNDKETIQNNNLSISQANQSKKNSLYKNKNCQYFRQYDAPISVDKCLHTLTSFIRALHIDINQNKATKKYNIIVVMCVCAYMYM